MYQKKITGRLGNQMFQYAAMKGIKRANNIEQPILLSFEKVYKRGFENELKEFNIKDYTEIKKVKITLKQKLFFYPIRIIEIFLEKIIKDRTKRELIELKLQRKVAPILSKYGVCYFVKGYYNFKLDKIAKKDIYFAGFFESDKYFNNIREELLEEFTPKEEKLEKNKELYQSIENSNSVCVTIRRGDFLSKEFEKEHYVCTKEYFYRAIELIKEKIDNPKFFIFSDDVNWCKNNMTFPEGTVFETGNDPVWEKLRLMYSCKHFIISNSTFSWWAQYLSRNNDKIVIAPNKWKNEGYNNDIFEDNWILIDTKKDKEENKMKVVSQYSYNSMHAGPKAKADIEKILKEEFNAEVKAYTYKETKKKSKVNDIILKLRKTLFCFLNFKKNELTIIQFPFSNKLLLTKKIKNKIAFIHDLDGLRKQEEKLNEKEMKFLKSCNYIVVHNKKMKSYLLENGINENKIYELELFDYLCEDTISDTRERELNYKTVAYTGNLVADKSPFLYQLDTEKMNFKLFLYGKGIKENINEKLVYRGAFKPEELPHKIEANLGLVWDGNFDESDEKLLFKNYNKYNNPHKLSCYIAAGIPVIVWRESAVADLVTNYNIGYTVSNIYDINNIDFSDYDIKRKNVLKLSQKVQEGFFTKKVIFEILKDYNKVKDEI